jgi:hypothetical protein
MSWIFLGMSNVISGIGVEIMRRFSLDKYYGGCQDPREKAIFMEIS